tara:strand:- start:47 stop:421 length:375 start_codon:yes stop_codon:yes gene_type:complete
MKTEHEEQREFVQWFRRTYAGVRIFAIPNGGGRSRSQGAKLKMEGVSPGVPDLFVPELLLWIEMKREKGGSLSAEQKDWLKYLETIGHHIIVGKGFDDAQRKVFTFLKASVNITSSANRNHPTG